MLMLMFMFIILRMLCSISTFNMYVIVSYSMHFSRKDSVTIFLVIVRHCVSLFFIFSMQIFPASKGEGTRMGFDQPTPSYLILLRMYMYIFYLIYVELIYTYNLVFFFFFNTYLSYSLFLTNQSQLVLLSQTRITLNIREDKGRLPEQTNQRDLTYILKKLVSYFSPNTLMIAIFVYI